MDGQLTTKTSKLHPSKFCTYTVFVKFGRNYTTANSSCNNDYAKYHIVQKFNSEKLDELDEWAEFSKFLTFHNVSLIKPTTVWPSFACRNFIYTSFVQSFS